jgi:hypothetical protein
MPVGGEAKGEVENGLNKLREPVLNVPLGIREADD